MDVIWRCESDMPLEFMFDTQLLLEGESLEPEVIREYITSNLYGDSLLVVGNSQLVKLHFHTNEPWEVLQYVSQLGSIFDIVIENMERQQNGLQG